MKRLLCCHDHTEHADVALTHTVAAQFGGLQVMVNNAGILGSAKPTDQVYGAVTGC